MFRVVWIKFIYQAHLVRNIDQVSAHGISPCRHLAVITREGKQFQQHWTLYSLKNITAVCNLFCVLHQEHELWTLLHMLHQSVVRKWHVHKISLQLSKEDSKAH
jgi:hypothetical protein